MKYKINHRIITRNLIILILLLIVILPKQEKAFKYKEQDYLIKENDTLWNIAEENKYPDEEIREYIDKVCRLNNDFSKNLTSGQSIKILVKD